MDRRPSQLAERLLPVPKELAVESGICPVGRDTRIELRLADKRVGRGVLDWHAGFTGSGEGTDVLVAEDRLTVGHPQGYRLSVRSGRIELTGGGAAGCFHGIQTLRFLSDAATGGVACCTIEDEPDFATRGLLHDVTRGKVPTLATLKTLVDRLALLKINQLQLNIEHAFVFSFDPEVCGPDDGLTPDEVRELDEYARERFVELVPALATFGHMGRILSMPKYRHLAEVEAAKPWSAMSWPERTRGLTLDCLNPEAHRLVERMWSDVLEAFSSPVVNICGDEPWDLGKGRNRNRLTGDALGEAYVAQVRRTHDFCRSRGRRTLFWSDIVAGYSHLLDALPGETTVLHWGYDDKADYARTADFVRAGIETCVCPGTSGWKRIINAMNLAERNIATFARVGKQCGAVGLLNTDWGDHGHFNSLSCSWHGIALGAALGWSSNHPTGKAFDRAFAHVFLDTDDASAVDWLREASAVGERCETWRQMWIPFEALAGERELPGREDLARSKESALRAGRWFESSPKSPCAIPQHQRAAGPSPRGESSCKRARSFGTTIGDAHLFEELALACAFHALWARKVAMFYETTAEERADWADRLKAAATRYARCWNASNKRSGLGDILDVLSRQTAT